MDALWLDERRKGWFGGGNDHPGLHAICVDPRDSNRVTIAISCGGVWRTLDAVAHWRLLGKGLHAPLRCCVGAPSHWLIAFNVKRPFIGA